MKKIFLPYLAATLLLTACGTNETTEQTTSDTTTTTAAAPTATETPAAAETSDLSAAGTEALINVREAYLLLKNAFVGTSGEVADLAAQDLVTAGEQLKMLLPGENKKELEPQVDSILNNAKAIVAINDDNAILGKKRAAFEHISNASYHLFQKAGFTNSGLYVQHCPMAFKNKGASWLSKEKKIRNPYYGDKMLECGEVTETMK